MFETKGKRKIMHKIKMNNYLSVVKGKTFPLDAVTQKCAFIGRSSSGKTYGAGKFVEELLEHNLQTVIIDPVGVWYGLRMNADGKAKGYSIPIFGGEHGDVPLPAHSGILIANLIVERGISAILDVSYMRKGERKQFITDFAEQFFHLKKKNRSAVHLVIEEAQTIIPQRTMHGEERMLGAMEDIVKLGRNYGIGITIISQRPQSVHKDCLNQTEALFAFQLNAVHERKAIKEWVEENCFDQKTQVEKLSTLEVGECFLWSPQWLKILDRVKILPKKTFDASKTPTMGHSKSMKSRQLAPVDLEKIKIDMESVIKEKKENDPSELKKKIFELEKMLNGKKGIVQAPPIKDTSEIMELRKQLSDAKKKIAEHESWNKDAIAVIDKMSHTLTENRQKLYGKNPPPLVATKMPITKNNDWASKIPKPPYDKSKLLILDDYRKLNTEIKNGSLAKGEKAVLIACASFTNGLLRTQITVLTQYTRSSRDAYIHRLKTKDYVTTDGGKIKITEAGVDVLGNDYQPLPTGDALMQHWLNALPKGEKIMLELIAGEYPNSISREELTDKTGYTRSSRDAYLHRMANKEIIDVTSRGEVKASQYLFE